MATAMTTCGVCEGRIHGTVICKQCQKPCCYICTDPNSVCIGCAYTYRRGRNRGKIVGNRELDPLPDATCDFCAKTMQGDMLTFCVGECRQRFCPDCLSNDAVQCACPPVED